MILEVYISFLFSDSFQVLIQYPDVVTAQSAKLVSLTLYMYSYNVFIIHAL